MLYFFRYAFCSIIKILNLNIKSPKIFAFHIFGMKCCFHPWMLSNTTSQKLFPSDRITLHIQICLSTVEYHSNLSNIHIHSFIPSHLDIFVSWIPAQLQVFKNSQIRTVEKIRLRDVTEDCTQQAEYCQYTFRTRVS